jgi:adenosylcobyric acid synthase
VARPQDLGAPDLIILPGSKSTAADLTWLRGTGLAEAVTTRARAGAAVLGICGGFQMLGRWLHDPLHVESEADATPGLDLLPLTTTFDPEKATHRVRALVEADRGLLAGAAGLELEGYEIHMGRTEHEGPPAVRILVRSGRPAEVPDGALDPEGWIWGTYVHGIFENHALRRRVLENLAARKGASLPEAAGPLDRDAEYDRLAAHVRAAMDMDLVYRLLERQ